MVHSRATLNHTALPAFALALPAFVLAVLTLGACGITSDDVRSQASQQNPDAALELREVNGVDIDRVPRASDAGSADEQSRPRQPAPLVLTAGAAPARPAVPDSERSGEKPADSSEDPTATPAAITPDPVAIAQEDVPASAGPGEPTAEPAAAPTPTLVPTALPAPTATPTSASLATGSNTSTSTTSPTATPVPTPHPTAAPVATTAPVVSDQLEVRPEPTVPALVSTEPGTAALSETAELSEAGALACARVELALGDLDRGDLAAFDAAMQTAAGYASAATEPEIIALETTVSSAASTPDPIAPITTFLTACVSLGYEL